MNKLKETVLNMSNNKIDKIDFCKEISNKIFYVLIENSNDSKKRFNVMILTDKDNNSYLPIFTSKEEIEGFNDKYKHKEITFDNILFMMKNEIDIVIDPYSIGLVINKNQVLDLKNNRIFDNKNIKGSLNRFLETLNLEKNKDKSHIDKQVQLVNKLLEDEEIAEFFVLMKISDNENIGLSVLSNDEQGLRAVPIFTTYELALKANEDQDYSIIKTPFTTLFKLVVEEKTDIIINPFSEHNFLLKH